MTTPAAFFVVDQFVLDNVFNKLVQSNGDTIYWRSVRGDCNGYIVLFQDGEHFHTYDFPPDVWK